MVALLGRLRLRGRRMGRVIERGRDRSPPLKPRSFGGRSDIADTQPIVKTPMTMKPTKTEELLQTLKTRFAKNMHRHAGTAWADVQAKLEGNQDALKSLQQMEATDGEPDVIGDEDLGHFIFCDCSPESPSGRRSTCYDAEARESRKKDKPETSAVEMAAEMGVELLTEERYRELQTLGEFDTKTSSWIKTPADVRALGGALFCDRRYGKVFVYHNGAESYYAARGFRGSLRV
jgi:hypothetical protein